MTVLLFKHILLFNNDAAALFNDHTLKIILDSFRQQDTLVDVIGTTWDEEDENNQNEDNNQLNLPVQTNPCEDSHEDSDNASPTTNDHHHQTQKSTGIRINNHIFKATEWSFFTFRKNRI